jgi:hypothetical protein
VGRVARMSKREVYVHNILYGIPQWRNHRGRRKRLWEENVKKKVLKN